MTDTGTDSKIRQVKLKGGAGEVPFDTSKVEDMAMYEYIFMTGVETLVNKVGMSKISAGLTKLEGEEKAKAIAAVVEQALKNIQAMYDGDLKGAKATSKRTGAVQTEAMRLAKALVKQTLRDNGYKLSAFDAKELTDFAKEVLKENQDLYKTAEENLKARAALPVKGLNVAAMLGERTSDETLKAKPKVPPKPKAKVKDVLSATQAGKVQPRAKPQAPTTH